MSNLHINQPQFDVYFAQVRARGDRKWRSVGRFDSELVAGTVALRELLNGQCSQFRVLADHDEPNYYEPVVVLEGRRR